MHTIRTIAGKELYATFTNRNLLLIMLLTPLALSLIIGLAFGGGGDSGPTIADVPVVVVNLDEGLDFGGLGTGAGDDQPFSFGAQLTSILGGTTGDGDGADAGNTFALPACGLVVGAAEGGGDDGGFDMTLEELLAVTTLDDAAAARALVDSGAQTVAVIIPPAFSRGMLPQFGGGAGNPFALSPDADVQIEVYGSGAHPVSESVVRSVVEGVTSQFARSSVALGAMADTVLNEVDLAQLDTGAVNADAVPAPDASWDEWRGFLLPLATASPWFGAIVNAGPDAVANLSCLFDPDLNAVKAVQQPLDDLQTQSRFNRVLVAIGAAQAVFFALFTGVFGVAGLYEERRQWTLQRLLVTPTPRWQVLAGFLTGNLVVVIMQLVLLLLALTVVASIVGGALTFIWGSNVGLLALLVLALALCVSGLGVLVVGIARTPEQVQIFGPMVNMTLAALGGAFGFALPAAVAQLSLITWGVDAFSALAAGDTDIWLHLAVLFGQGILFFGIGVWLFRRRMSL
ncbi:MAG: ABC transporter permease [Caldilineaceae bacterium]|nr:ABC transporter permease [Caldilineaceae bacterium]